MVLSKILIFLLSLILNNDFDQEKRKTTVAIKGDQFYINGKPTYQNRVWNGQKIEGLLMNSRMVQGIFDDLNPETVFNWEYPDSGKWDPERNTDEFIANMEEWRNHGLLSFTINLQGGSPFGYSQSQPWYNSAFTEKGELRGDYMGRLKRILDKADELGMVPIVGYFYFGQDQRLQDEQAVIAAVQNATDWLHDGGYRNVLIEINNECDVDAYDHEILKPARVHELITLAKNIEKKGYRFYVSTSYGGGSIPKPNVVKVSDFILLHGNGVSNPDRIVEMVNLTKEVEGYQKMPILFNEDDHFDFDKDSNNFKAAVSAYTSWGLFDYRMKDEGFEQGYQSVPVDWGTNSERKKGFFKLLKEITGN
ncbi:hypothetical protein M3O96_16790 [Aquiflexum sp. TKW24L]|uniref:hypothetical protein n=1 Tax=Aquiflexum sp. TKW24L TaxID=2942212 RepID=UPI0020BF53E6|nr:hypothetical protein [Aquiflexum sp. TKW24L]MCL6260761.1 hypothetical protein [Aquiflexum sp. TKW24L]